jgi:phosphoribosylformylglycinamidine (FGAM) synthase PurS component
MGHPEITNLRQGKYFEVEIDGLENKETVRQLMEELSRDVLCNPIIESFEIEDIS